MNQGWNCPNCGKAHAPHIETCPEPGANQDFISISDFSQLDELKMAFSAYPQHQEYTPGPQYTITDVDMAGKESIHAKIDGKWRLVNEPLT